MENSGLRLDDPNFIDQSNVLGNISGGPENYFQQLHLIDTITFRRPTEYKKDMERRHRRLYKTNETGLFLYYIVDPSKLSLETLVTLERYQILAGLSSEAYHTNCFLYALRQSKVVPKDVISTIKSCIIHNYIKSKDIGFSGKKVCLGFFTRKPEDRPSRRDIIKLDKLRNKKDNYIKGSRLCDNPIELLWYETIGCFTAKTSSTTAILTTRTNF